MRKTPLESSVVRDAIRALQGLKYSVWKINGNGYQRSGLPDLVTIDANGRFVGLEVKRPKPSSYRVTGLQRRTLAAINRAGGYARVIRSADAALLAVVYSERGDVVTDADPLELEVR